MVHMAMNVESQLKRKRAARFSLRSNNTWRLKWNSNNVSNRAISKRKTEPPKKKEDVTSNNKLKSDFQPSKNMDIKCFKCLGFRHIVSKFPNKRVMILCDNGEVETEDDNDSDEMPELEDDGVEYPVDGEVLVCTQRILYSTTKNNQTIFLLQELEDVSSEEMSSKLSHIQDIAHQLYFVPGVVLSKRPTYKSNPDETNELQRHQFKANKVCRFIFESGDWVWVHMRMEGDIYLFDGGDDSRLNPFEEGGEMMRSTRAMDLCYI
ncbi:CCHC-type domain-containing protein [Abeliophyllum distichum]|uniref:CCHC-type domain-containing protein n=1 Tax=Abeliophyllum distichum TaxID=126358 RepID=A0ABD1QEB5_9LAMI